MFGILIIFLFFSLFTELNHFSIPELQVNCGDRVEQSCSDCPNGNGPSGCDGDCMWKNSTVSGQQCIQKGKKQIITYSCSLLLFYMTMRKNSRLIDILHSSQISFSQHMNMKHKELMGEKKSWERTVAYGRIGKLLKWLVQQLLIALDILLFVLNIQR